MVNRDYTLGWSIDHSFNHFYKYEKHKNVCLRSLCRDPTPLLTSDHIKSLLLYKKGQYCSSRLLKRRETRQHMRINEERITENIATNSTTSLLAKKDKEPWFSASLVLLIFSCLQVALWLYWLCNLTLHKRVQSSYCAGLSKLIDKSYFQYCPLKGQQTIAAY